jgi:Asp/Glu/hydantoin racemase
MTTRLLCQSIWTEEVPFFDAHPIREGQRRVCEAAARPGTVCEFRYVPHSTYATSYAYLAMLNNAALVQGIIDGEAEGFDAAVISCGNDPALREAREMVDYPVVGITEAGMHLACQMGARFALIVVEEPQVPQVERNLTLYGLRERAIAHRPVRSCERSHDMPDWFQSPDYAREHLVPAFERVALECIDDGAEVIVTACGGLSALTLAGYHEVRDTRVPVVDALVAGVKMAEARADLHRTFGISTSKRLTYASPSRETLESVLPPFFEMAAEHWKMRGKDGS